MIDKNASCAFYASQEAFSCCFIRLSHYEIVTLQMTKHFLYIEEFSMNLKKIIYESFSFIHYKNKRID